MTRRPICTSSSPLSIDIGSTFASTVSPMESLPSAATPSVTEQPRRLRKAEAILQRRTSRMVLILEMTPTDSASQHAVLRSAENFGIQHVWMIDLNGKRTSVDQLHTYRTLKISRTACKWLSLQVFCSVQECLDELKKRNLELWAAEFHPQSRDAVLNLCRDDEWRKGADPAMAATASSRPCAEGGTGRVPKLQLLRPSMLPEQFALVIGNEELPLSEVLLKAASKHIYLPLQGQTGFYPSLSIASALLLQHLFLLADQDMETLRCAGAPDADVSRRRMVGNMSLEERQALRTQWYAALIKHDKHREEYARWMVTGQPVEPAEDLRTQEELRNQVDVCVCVDV